MPDPLRERVRELMARARADLAHLVSIKSVADPRQYPAAECAKAAQYVASSFADAGLKDVRLYPTPDGSDAVIGHAPGPPAAPTVLLYSHYDVQPPLGERHWDTPVWTLTGKGGRWYGRGAADCKGNIVTLLTALRALGGGDFPVAVKIVVEGSEEQGTGGLEAFVTQNPDLLAADVILVCDAGNVAAGVPTVTTTLRGIANIAVTVRALRSSVHSGMFGGPAPDALAALVHMLATLRDASGDTTIRGLGNRQAWPGKQYPADQFRKDATVLDGVDLIGSGSVAEMLWARPALTILGIDCSPVVGSSPAIHPEVRARLSLRVPPGTDATAAQDALIDHLKAVAPWRVQIEVEREGIGQPFTARTSGPAYAALGAAMRDTFGREMTMAGQGGSIPLCNVFHETYPDTEIALIGVEEPQCLIHAPNESVCPAEIENMALAVALFLQRLGAGAA